MTDWITIDTDPGIDDALALLFSSCNNLPIQAITTVYGNSTVENVTKNAGYIVKSIKADWDIYKGAQKPVSGLSRLAESHGLTGLGEVQPASTQVKQPRSKTAQDYLTNLHDLDNNVLFCLGPLTNLSLALKSKPDLLQHIKQLVIMGGAFVEKGNVTEFAEFNIYNDPEAAAIVFDTAYEQQTDTAIIPAEVCRKVLLTKDDLQLLEDANLLPDIKAIVEPFIDYYLNDKTNGGYVGAVLYDVLVPLYYLNPELFTVVPSTVKVQLGSGADRGKTTAIDDRNSSIKVCADIDGVIAKELVMNALVGSSLVR